MSLTPRAEALFDEVEVGNAHFLEERFAEAAAVYEAIIATLEPRDDGLAAPIFENLGLAYWFLGRTEAAERAFLRAGDEAPPREQSLRFAVMCALRRRRPRDAARRLARYEALFGPHPEGLTAETMAEATERWRDALRRATPC